jgi:hypothetical protein
MFIFFVAKKFAANALSRNIRCQFHQHFTPAFFVRKRIFGAKILYESALHFAVHSLHSFVIFGAKILYEKCASKMLMKLTTAVAGESVNSLFRAKKFITFFREHPERYV